MGGLFDDGGVAVALGVGAAFEVVVPHGDAVDAGEGEGERGADDVVAHGIQSALGGAGDAVGDVDLVGRGGEAGGLDGFLHGHAEVEHVDDPLEDGDADTGAAGGADGHDGLFPFEDDGGGEGGEAALAGGDGAGVAGAGVVPVHGAVEHEAGAGGDDAGGGETVQLKSSFY